MQPHLSHSTMQSSRYWEMDPHRIKTGRIHSKREMVSSQMMKSENRGFLVEIRLGFNTINPSFLLRTS